MFDLGWSELMVVMIIALIVIGPKDLPMALRQLGKWVGAARRMTGEFQRHVDDIVRETELEDVKKGIDKVCSVNIKRELEKQLDPDGSLTKAFNVNDSGKSAAKAGGKSIAADGVNQAGSPVGSKERSPERSPERSWSEDDRGASAAGAGARAEPAAPTTASDSGPGSAAIDRKQISQPVPAAETSPSGGRDARAGQAPANGTSANGADGRSAASTVDRARNPEHVISPDSKT